MSRSSSYMVHTCLKETLAVYSCCTSFNSSVSYTLLFWFQQTGIITYYSLFSEVLEIFLNETISHRKWLVHWLLGWANGSKFVLCCAWVCTTKLLFCNHLWSLCVMCNLSPSFCVFFWLYKFPLHRMQKCSTAATLALHFAWRNGNLFLHDTSYRKECVPERKGATVTWYVKDTSTMLVHYL